MNSDPISAAVIDPEEMTCRELVARMKLRGFILILGLAAGLASIAFGLGVGLERLRGNIDLGNAPVREQLDSGSDADAASDFSACGVPGPPRIQGILISIVLANYVRWTLIDPYAKGWTDLNCGKRSQEVLALLTEIKELADSHRMLDSSYNVRDLFDAPGDLATVDRLYREFEDIDADLEVEIAAGNSEGICRQLERWRRGNSEYMQIASSRLRELVSQAFRIHVTAGT